MRLIKQLFNSERKNKSASKVNKSVLESSLGEVQEPFSVGATVYLVYVDSAGNETERVVDIKTFGDALDTNLLVGVCRLRNAIRSFRVDRIRRCADMETGEIIEDVAQYLRDKYASSPEHSRNKLITDEYDVLQLLLYVGKADGVLRAKEKIIMREFCRELANDTRMTDKMIDALFKGLSVPTTRAFKLAVGRLSNKSVILKAQIFAAAEKMVASDNKIHQSEQEALDYMKEKWRI